MKFEGLPSVLDREINDRGQDAFGHSDFAEALRSLVESPTNVPPLSIGLLGGWGTGKSTIKQLYIQDVKRDREADPSGIIRSQKIKIVTFNAWRFGGEGNLKRPLLKSVFLELGGDSNELTDILFRQRTTSDAKRKSRGEIADEIFEKYLFNLVPLLGYAVFCIIVMWFAICVLKITGDIQKTIIAACTVAAGGALTWGLKDPSRFMIARTKTITKVESPNAAAEQFEELLHDQIQKFARSKEGKHCERLVIFVDDLDRLSAEELVAGLDAIRSFMEMPMNGDASKLGVVFVISCDEARVAEALAKRRRSPDLPGAVQTEPDARRYLDRIFQFRLEIPPPPRQDLRLYAEERMRTSLAPLVQDMAASNVSLGELTSRMIHSGVQTPRNVIQILNAFAESWWVAKKREREGSGTSKSGGLASGSVTKHPVSLAILSAMRVNFPGFYREMQNDPSVLSAFIEVVFRGGDLANLPENARRTVSAMLEAGGANKTQPKVKEENEDFRRFASSIRDHRWPRALKPLLLLSQDPMTRKLGLDDKATDIRESLLDSDDHRILKLLGHEYDSKPLTGEESEGLKLIAEDLENEPDARKDNAATAIAALIPRMPEALAKNLATPVLRRLQESVEMRSKIGPERMAGLIELGVPDDQRFLAAKLVDDCLQSDPGFALKTTGDATPTIDEAAQMTPVICDIVLDVRKNHGLPALADARLIKWLETPRVTTGGKSVVFTPRNVEDWLNVHEEHLLLPMRDFYGASVIPAFQVFPDDLRANTLRRIETVQRLLLDGDSEERDKFWENILMCINQEAPDLVRMGYQLSDEFSMKGNDKQLAKVTIALCSRIVKAIKTTGDALDWRLASHALIGMLSRTSVGYSSDDTPAFAELLNSFTAMGDEGEAFALAVADGLVTSAPAMIQGTLETWIRDVLNNLPRQRVDWLGKNIARLGEPNQKALLVAIQNWMATTFQPNDLARERAKWFTDALPEEFMASHQAETVHLWTVAFRVNRQNPNIAVRNALPAIARLLPIASIGETVAVLDHAYNVNANNLANLFFVVAELKGSWPRRQDGINYTAESYFDRGMPAVQNQVADSLSGAGLLSLRDLYSAANLAEGYAVKLCSLAIAIWQRHPGEAANVLQGLSVTPPLQETANLGERTDFSSEGNLQALKETWRSLASKYSDSELVECTLQLALKPVVSSGSGGDPALDEWINAMGERRHGVLVSALEQENTNDGQRKRIWLQIEKHLEEFPIELLSKAIMAILQRRDNPDTAYTLGVAEPAVAKAMKSREDEHQLSSDILAAFRNFPDVDRKRQARNLLRRLNSLGAIADCKWGMDYSPEDLALLSEAFPDDHGLKKARKQGEKT